MSSAFDMINQIRKELKIKPLAFGFAGEVYAQPVDQDGWQSEIISKYIFVYQNVCTNRNARYYSQSFSAALAIIGQAQDDYRLIQQAQMDIAFKRYALFSIIEYSIHAICKLLHICFENKAFRAEFYSALKNQLESYTDVLVKLMFSEILPEMQVLQNSLCDKMNAFFSGGDVPLLRDHVEYDHKLLLVYAYILYFDKIDASKLLICPLLGAAQIPPFFNAMEKYFGKRFCTSGVIAYDYVKHSTYDVTAAFSLDEQLAELTKVHSGYANVILLDESLGTGTTLLEIKTALQNYFAYIKIGAVEFRWDKKIVWNTDREWFDMNRIDYISPIAYRHYTVLAGQIACFKMHVSNPAPYVPFMIFDDCNFENYMARQEIDDEKKKIMDDFFCKSRRVKEVFYPNVKWGGELA